MVSRAPLPHLAERKSSIYKGMMSSSLYSQCLIRIWEAKAQGNPVTWAFFWLEFMLFAHGAHFGPLCCKMGLSRTGCAETWARVSVWRVALERSNLRGNFKPDYSGVMRSKTGNQGIGQWDAEQEEEDTEIISTTETSWSMKIDIPAEKPFQNLQFSVPLLETEESPDSWCFFITYHPWTFAVQ